MSGHLAVKTEGKLPTCDLPENGRRSPNLSSKGRALSVVLDERMRIAPCATLQRRQHI